jgi:prefoldin subunit 5
MLKGDKEKLRDLIEEARKLRERAEELQAQSEALRKSIEQRQRADNKNDTKAKARRTN